MATFLASKVNSPKQGAERSYDSRHLYQQQMSVNFCQCVYVQVWECTSVSMHVFEGQGGKEGERERKSVCVCVCVCVP